MGGDGLDAGSGCENGVGFGGAEAVVPLEVIDQVFDVLVERLWLVRENRDGRCFFGVGGHAGWVPDGESLGVDHGQSRGGREGERVRVTGREGNDERGYRGRRLRGR